MTKLTDHIASKLRNKLAHSDKPSRNLETLRQHGQALESAIINNTLPRRLSEFALSHRLCHGTAQREIEQLKTLTKHWPVVLANGQILGEKKYELLDLRWVEATLAWLDDIPLPKFPTQPPIMTIPNTVKLAIFGDWGSGNWHNNHTASTISNLITNHHVDYAIHLGDVYYSGSQMEQYEHILGYWPTAKQGNFTLNGNHDMYHSARPYFNWVLSDERFSHQQNCSFFALENRHWIIVGLDTAFFANREQLYLHGHLDPTQIHFLQQLAQRNKPVIVLSHHNGLDITGQTPQTPLWQQVTDNLGKSLKYWYWGHEHIGAVYKPYNGVNPRVVGHGAIPYGHANDLANSDCVTWFEHHTANDPYNTIRIQNGFLILNLADEGIEEHFYGEDGKMHWSHSALY